jgi:hypothetical protein
MHAVAEFFASTIAFVSGFFAPPVASHSPIDVRATQPAAATVAPGEHTILYTVTSRTACNESGRRQKRGARCPLSLTKMQSPQSQK